jgi:hypothetical protein
VWVPGYNEYALNILLLVNIPNKCPEPRIMPIILSLPATECHHRRNMNSEDIRQKATGTVRTVYQPCYESYDHREILLFEYTILGVLLFSIKNGDIFL